jgi:hypothetical protein
MASRYDQDTQDGPGPSWWEQNAPPPPSSGVTQGTTDWIPDGHGSIMPPQSQWPAGKVWDYTVAGFVDAPKPAAPPPGPAPAPAPAPGMPTTGFGAVPPPYASNPDAPAYTPMPTYVPPTWTGGDYQNPTVEDLYASPGYQARLDDRLRGASRAYAAQGTILNGGTLRALDRSAQDYATNEYQTLRNNTYDAYVQKYKQFTDAAGMDLNARTVNANENQNNFANRLSLYNTGNARTLSDYLTNVTTKRNAELDYWNRLQDVNQTGAGLAGGSR